MTEVLSRNDSAYTPEETTRLLRKRLGEGVLDTTVEYGLFTVDLSPDVYADAALICRDEANLAFDLFDSSFGVDAGEAGFQVVTILYSTTKGARIALRCLAAGGREAPVAPTLSGIYPGADWMERETWDMFGVEFEGHPGLAPRILTTENFEGWPLRKDFHLASRAAKPWPGVKEPAELDEDGNVVQREPRIGDAPGPTALDKAMAEQAQAANPLPEPEPAETAEAADIPPREGSDEPTVEQDVDAGTKAAEVAESVEDAKNDAKQKAEEKRKAQAEARARKAAERAEAANVTTPEDEVPPAIPKAAAASPLAGSQGGPPAEGPAPDSGSNAEPPAGTVEGGISETVERDREGRRDLGDDAEAPVEPEGRDVDEAENDRDQEGDA